MSKKRIALLLFVLFCVQTSISQEKEKVKDSAKVYKQIQEYSKRNKFMKFVHGLVFEPIKVKKKSAKRKPKKVPKITYKPFEGKIIRHINVETLDPFGFSEKNTTDAPKKTLSKLGNRIHLKTKVLTIRNLLLIRRNRPLDSLLVKESERLVRTQRYVRGVIISPQMISPTSDSVDINIRVLDSWSLIPDISGNPNRANFELIERNFLGLGHQFENAYQRDFDVARSAYSTRYTIPNVMNTYIKTAITYQINVDRDYVKSINIERPFFSPFARWAGGVYFDQQFRTDTLPDAANVFNRESFKFSTQDFWGGHAYRIFRSNTEEDRTTNLITTARYLNLRFTESPTIAYDSIDFYSNERFYLAGIGISSRQFVEEKYIFNYGIVEDVPVGRAFGITVGLQQKNNITRPYAGGRFTMGKYYKFGYLSSNFEYGTFFKDGNTEQSAFAIQANYFTNLIERSKWKFRQFIKSRLVLGQNRQASDGDLLTINNEQGIQGFDPPFLFGSKKFVTTFQTQAYSPWNLGGFRLNPYISYSMGLLGNSGTGFKKSRAFSQFGAGVIISNDYLVFSAFQLSIAYYPTIPGNGDGIFKTNAFNTEDFGFQNFEIAKPRTVDYQ